MVWYPDWGVNVDVGVNKRFIAYVVQLLEADEKDIAENEVLEYSS